MRSYRNSIYGFATLLLAGVLTASAQTRWEVATTFHVGGEGGWDYVTVDAPQHRLFVTRATHTMAIDTNTGKVIADIKGQVRSHGVALVPKLGRGFITDGGGSGAIIVFDLKTYKVLGRIRTMPDTDGIIYDPALDKVIAVSGDGDALMTFSPNIDPGNGAIDPPIQLGGSPEFLASDGSGKVYVNLADKGRVAVVDLRTRKVIDRWPVAPGSKPVGMAIDPAKHLLFIGCRGPQKLVVMNTGDGKVEESLPIGSGNDAVRYFDGQVFASCRDGSLTVATAQQNDFKVTQIVKTADGARTMGLDPMSKEIFLPTAVAEARNSNGPAMRSGSFEILVLKPSK